jgi:Fasciclin domain
MPRLAAVLLVALAVGGCLGSDDDDAPQPRVATPEPTPAAEPVTVAGPLCDLLPSGDDPGAPSLIAGESADVVLTWIPVVTTFEAAVRASGMDAELRDMDDITILAPTDAAFERAISQTRLDRLLLRRRGELRRLLRAHVIEGELSLAELRDRGRVTTLAGTRLATRPAGTMARVGNARTVCADYQAANARIHVIGAVLGAGSGAPPTRPERHLG